MSRPRNLTDEERKMVVREATAQVRFQLIAGTITEIRDDDLSSGKGGLEICVGRKGMFEHGPETLGVSATYAAVNTWQDASWMGNSSIGVKWTLPSSIASAWSERAAAIKAKRQANGRLGGRPRTK